MQRKSFKLIAVLQGSKSDLLRAKKKKFISQNIHNINEPPRYILSAIHLHLPLSVAAYTCHLRRVNTMPSPVLKKLSFCDLYRCEECAKNGICLIFSIVSVCIVLLLFTLEKSPTTQSKWNCILLYTVPRHTIVNSNLLGSIFLLWTTKKGNIVTL